VHRGRRTGHELRDTDPAVAVGVQSVKTGERRLPVGNRDRHQCEVFVLDDELSAENLQRVALGPEKSVALLRTLT
jgi:hypothetical protein